MGVKEEWRDRLIIINNCELSWTFYSIACWCSSDWTWDARSRSIDVLLCSSWLDFLATDRECCIPFLKQILTRTTKCQLSSAEEEEPRLTLSTLLWQSSSSLSSELMRQLVCYCILSQERLDQVQISGLTNYRNKIVDSKNKNPDRHWLFPFDKITTPTQIIIHVWTLHNVQRRLLLKSQRHWTYSRVSHWRNSPEMNSMAFDSIDKHLGNRLINSKKSILLSCYSTWTFIESVTKWG